MSMRALHERRAEHGVAMVVVVMLVVLCATVTMVVASSSMFGTVQTATDRARLQALSAAEAGRDFALSKAPCVGASPPSYNEKSTGVPPGAPKFSTTYYWHAGTTPPSGLPSGGPACPPVLDPDLDPDPQSGYIGIEAVGTAPRGGSSTALTKRVVAWYPYTPGTLLPSTYMSPSPTTISSAAPPTGGGIAGAIVEGSGGSGKVDLGGMQEAGGAVVYDVTGSSGLDCTGMAVNGDLILWSSTNTPVDIKCTNGSVGGTLYVSGNVTIKGAMSVHDVVSVGGSVTVGKKEIVTGSIWASKGITVNSGGKVTGTQHPGALPATLPSVFSSDHHLWTDYTMANVPWSDTDHYNVQILDKCSGDWLSKIASSASKSTIVDATKCSSVDISTLALSHDMTVLLPASAVSLQGGSVSSADGYPHEFNVIQPDQLAGNYRPDWPSACPANTVLKIDGFTMNPGQPAGGSGPITGLAYTPCTMDAGGTQGGTAANWEGQLYAGSFAGFQSKDHRIRFVKVPNVPGASDPGGFGTTTTTYTSIPTTVPVAMPTTTTETPVMHPSLVQQTEP